MTIVEGILSIQREKGSEVILLDDQPLSKMFNHVSGVDILFTISSEPDIFYSVSGIADVFYFEGIQQSNKGIKYVNDFFIDDFDVIEVLEKLEGKRVKLSLQVNQV
ncbi:hypothetical protein [Fredinandcohnia sp. 179-A 10B2 NHS]|uniref:hypothetical protein n=1 Tax=Fredinandcohnia sp. 179-A 10B2 NHS TaxID=3235176 RepID=UPI0039A2C61A